MKMNAAEVEQALLALSRKERAAVVHRGIQSLDDFDEDLDIDQAEIDTAWRDEVSRRIEDIESGKVETISVDESFARARAALAAMRK